MLLLLMMNNRLMVLVITITVMASLSEDFESVLPLFLSSSAVAIRLNKLMSICVDIWQ